MPYIDLRTNTQPSPKVRDALLADIVKVTAKHLGKTEAVTMARISTGEAMFFNGSVAPTAYVSVRAIGLPPLEDRKALVVALSTYLEDVLAVPNDRVFVVFDDVSGDRWGVRNTILS